MEGGPSHLDLFDPKPALDRLAGQPVPKNFGRVITSMGEFDSPILGSKRTWKQYGEGGLWISDWLPHIAMQADELAVIRSCWTNGINHSGGVCQMNTGIQFAGRPALGSWVTYGLGTENENLLAFVVMQDREDVVVNGPRNWGTGFMPWTIRNSSISLPDVPSGSMPTKDTSTRELRHEPSRGALGIGITWAIAPPTRTVRRLTRADFAWPSVSGGRVRPIVSDHLG